MFQGTGADAAHSYGSNIGVILGRKGQIVVDSGFHNSTARQVLRFLNRPNNRTASKYIVNTHYHSDHTFGNSVLAANGSPVIAQERARYEMQQQSKKLLEGYRQRSPELSRMLQGVEVHLPIITFKDKIQVYMDDLSKIELVHPGYRAHTDGDAIVHVIKDRVVYAGDLLWVNYHTNLEDADIPGLVRALKMILRLKPRRIVPGHGPVSGIGEVRRFIKYLKQLDLNSKKTIRKGLRGGELFRAVIPSWSWSWKMRWMIESYLEDLAAKEQSTY